MSPLKMFEYMAMNRAIIASDLPVLREVLDNKTAMMVEPDKATAWIHALKTLRDENARTQISAAAAQLALRYDWRRRAEHILHGS
jgi:glycosyltransferase involved in cell wall biosynthesis